MLYQLPARLTVYVLPKASAEGCMDQLMPAAYPEQGYLAGSSQPQQYQLIFISECIHVLKSRHRLFTQIERIDVSPPAQQQAVQTCNDSLQCSYIRHGGNQHRCSSGIQHGTHIRLGYTGKPVLLIGGYAYAGRAGRFVRHVPVNFPIQSLPVRMASLNIHKRLLYIT
ncbi:hypothetical protein Barb6_02895 [Bacteroidales bacterium Barb6]|nr:hypothetical protein Barb6_02895 [Bacteroidales bacterium Barb6]